jgi:hypothetical protein
MALLGDEACRRDLRRENRRRALNAYSQSAMFAAWREAFSL